MKLNDDCIKALNQKNDLQKEIIENAGFYFAIRNYNKDFIGFDLDKDYYQKAKSILECLEQKK